MTRDAIVDNWSLQHISDLLANGISGSAVSVVNVSGNDHKYIDILEGAIQTEALFDLLTEIVLRDEIIIDSAFTDTWDLDNDSFDPLTRSGLLRKVPFLDNEEQFADFREFIVDRLCVTDSLRKAHADNVDCWSLSKETPDPYLASVLWGGAGMVARSWTFESPYCPHPLRRRLFESAKLFFGE